jgi:hypothetical protein
LLTCCLTPQYSLVGRMLRGIGRLRRNACDDCRRLRPACASA